MPTAVDSRQQIADALGAFRKLPLRKAATDFLGTLGYASSRTLLTDSVEDFCRQFDTSGLLEHPAALKKDWKSIDLLFQLTDQDIAAQDELFDTRKVQPSLLKSYLFFAVELTGDNYARGKLTALARQINRLFPIPVMVLIKHSSDKKEVLSIAVINRRQNQRDAAKDVLGKVTIIRDISLVEPHRGHLDILDSLVVDNLVHPEKKPINDFDSLHAAWEEIFNIELLNKRFYKELSNWYFWALPQVEFPDDLEKDSEKRRATGLIRLLTRLIFCWFLKEKDGLIPEKLFHPVDLAKILKGFDPESETSSAFYLAILQNLFFATLNQRMGKDSKGNPYRAFATDEGFQKNRATYDVNTLYRYEKLFAIPEEEVVTLFADIPFLNGGLFECLDRTEEGTDKKLYLDGFSRNAKKRPHVPDRLFFDSGETADLSDVYGDKKRRAEKVTGLISILNRYKFTIVENTPIDQEIALDPELLGKVFENLLASYNEETKTTARKQTGSFYTPRPIVEYMVDESLKAHLTSILVEKIAMKEDDAKAGLDLLLTYTEKEHPFAAREVAVLITAINEVKILDPAVGSGAFPMGVLHKLVYILGKLDPRNERLEQIRIDEAQKIKDADERRRAVAEIVSNFADNNDDYGRKLYLIENCLYGVDIQPIAIQITKLRFFISLVCDQKTNRNKKDNHGIRPLPNLETKFVAADTLVGLPISEKDLFIDSVVAPMEKEIEDAYHGHFTIQRRDQKIALQKQIKALRLRLAHTLASSLGAVNSAKAKHLADWDPFDPRCTADFFDPHWMFGRSLKGGFDIVIGNPPYISVEKFSRTKRQSLWQKTFKTFSPRGDIYCFFYERGLSLLRPRGVLAFITSNKFQKAGYGRALRQLLASQHIHAIVDFCELPVFAAAADPVIFVCSKDSPRPAHVFPVLVVKEDREFGNLPAFVASRSSLYKTDQLQAEGWSLECGGGGALVDKLRSTGTPLVRYVNGCIYYGIKTGLNEAYVIDRSKRDELVRADPNSAAIIGPWIRGRDIKRWVYNKPDLYFIRIPSSENARHPWTGASHVDAVRIFAESYPAVASHLLPFESALRARTDQGVFFWELRSCSYWHEFATPCVVYADIGQRLKAFHSTDGIYFGNTVYFIPNAEPWMTALLTSSALDFFYRHNMQPLGDPWTNGRMRFFSRSMNLVPIPAVSSADKGKLTKLAQASVAAATACDVSTIEALARDIDAIVYRLFQLTPAETNQIETSLANTRNASSNDEGDSDE